MTAFLPIIISLALAILYSCYFNRDINFWDGIIGIFLSLVAGIPFALWIDGLIKSREETEKLKEDRLREKDILLFIKQEMDFNSGLILASRDIRSSAFHPLQVEMWEVLKSSGDLKLIINTELLNRITSAYDITIKVKHFEEKALDDWNVENSARDIGSTWQVQLNRAKNFYGLLDTSLSTATMAISSRIEEVDRML